MKIIDFFKRVILPCVLFLAFLLPSWGQEMNTKVMDEFTQKYNEHDYSKAIELGEQVLENLKDFPDLYCIYSNYVIDCYNNVGDKKKAQQLAAKVEGMRKNLDANKNLEVDNLDRQIEALKFQALKYLYAGEYEKAKDKFNKIIEIHGTAKDEIYGMALDGLAICYQSLGEYPKAINYYKQSQQIAKEVFGENSIEYAKSLNNYGYCLALIGNNNEAIEQHKNSLKIREAILPPNHPDIASSLGNIGLCLLNQGKYRDAISYFEKTLIIQEKNFDENHPDVIRTRTNLATCHQMLGEYDKAYSEYEKTDGNNTMTNHPDAATIANNKAWMCYDQGNYDNAIEHFLKAIEILENSVGEPHPDIVKSLKGLSYCYNAKGDNKKFQTYCDALNMEQSLLLNSLGYFNENLRNIYWNRYSSDFLSFYPDLIVSENRKDLAGELYNKSALFAKGLLLCASTEMRRNVLDSKDPVAIENLNKLEASRSKIDELKTKGQSTKSLEDEADRLESELMAFLKNQNIDILQNLRLKWTDVKAKLNEDDLAIEFLSFDDPGEETPYYVALTLRKNYDLPHIIKIGRESALLKYTKNAYTSVEASAFIWAKFLFNSELDGVNNIYFSPSGKLHNIAIEYMPYWMDENMTVSDVYNIYRLSSTRELTLKRKPVDGANGASVYGGISYNASIKAMGTPRFGGREIYSTHAELPPPEVLPTQDKKSGYRGGWDVVVHNGTRALHWESLSGSGDEAIKISSLIKHKMDTTFLMTDSIATETSLKALSGQKRKLLHISTHGFYWSDTAALKHKNMILMPSNYEKMQEQDKSMVRSGLLFAGAQNTFFHKAIPEGVDDGVLTAKEVSQLDLRGLDLVVLSACQTALGDISGEGVFGLQRGFKMAGTQSIIMSLWPVSDKATLYMMTEFYKAYNPEKNNKREAFLIAQQKVREKYENFEDENKEFFTDKPHWAAFILLDALD